jgi:hypothetical protein
MRLRPNKVLKRMLDCSNNERVGDVGGCLYSQCLSLRELIRVFEVLGR